MSANDHVIRATVIGDITRERQRQVEEEGWSLAHDDEHGDGELATAAACYALEPSERAMEGGHWTYGGRDPELSKWVGSRPQLWPWRADWWRPSSRRRDLIKAAALIVAEIERLDRLAGSAAPPRVGHE